MHMKSAVTAAQSDNKTISHPIPAVWNAQSRVLILGTMPSPKSREIGFFYMHPQNRFWTVLPAVFGEELSLPNNSPDSAAVIDERRDFLLKHNIALWDVLASCEINGAADSTIKHEVPNDFSLIFENSQIHHVFCTGKTAYDLWKKHCSALYEKRYNLKVCCLPSTSPANAAWNKARLLEAYREILKAF